MRDDEPFMARWWRRKTAAATNARHAAPARTPQGAPSRDTPPVPLTHPQASGAAERPHAHPNPEAEFADIDFEALGAHSDYKRFLVPGVPEDVKTKALARLWRSHPAFAQADPLQDYAGDFTDKALAAPADVLQTAYRIGRGFVTEEEAQEPCEARKPAEEKP